MLGFVTAALETTGMHADLPGNRVRERNRT